MKIIWHILKKDFRRRRWMLLLLASVWLAKTAMLYEMQVLVYHGRWYYQTFALNGLGLIDARLSFAGYENEDTFALVARIGSFADIYVLAGIIFCVIAEDSPLNPWSFWRTRPVGYRQLIAAKALFIALVVWPVPVVLQLTANLFGAGLADFSHYWTSHLLDGMPTLILIQAAWAAAAVLVAALWRNRFIGISVMVIIFCVMLNLAMAFGWWEHPHFAWVVPAGLAGSAGIAYAMYRRSSRRFGYALLAELAVGIFILLSIP